MSMMNISESDNTKNINSRRNCYDSSDYNINNDSIVIESKRQQDNRKGVGIPQTTKERGIQHCCHQEFGFGAMMLLNGPFVAMKAYATYKATLAMYNAGIFITSWGAGMIASYTMLQMGSKAFTKFFGEQALGDLNMTMNKIWNTTSSNMQREKQNTSNSDSFSNLLKQGKNASKADIMKLRSDKNIAFSMVVLGTLLTYLHNMGAMEMQKKIRLHAAARSRVLFQGNEDTRTRKSENSKKDGLFSGYFGSITGLFFSSKSKQDSVVVAANNNDNDADIAAVVSASATENEDGLLQQQLRKLYEKHPFYAINASNAANDGESISGLFNPKDANVVRIIFNIILGIILQLNALWVGKQNDSDPIKTIASFTSFVMYWEVLTRVLKLYGWAPLYVATRQVMLLITSSSKKNK